MSDRALGVLIGVLVSIIVTAGLTVLAVVDPELFGLLSGWRMRPNDPTDPIVLLLLCGVPLGVLYGSLIGSVPGAHRLSQNGKVTVFATAALVCLAISLTWWPELGLFSVPLTMLHAAYVHRHVDPPPPLPVATVRKWSAGTRAPLLP